MRLHTRRTIWALGLLLGVVALGWLGWDAQAEALGEAVSAALGAASPVFANQVVMNLNDSGAGSLRQAIADVGAGETISFAVTGTITLASELAINKSLTIQGPGASLLTISGNNAVRVFNIGSVTPAINVTLSGLTIANGLHRGVDGNPGSNGFGGGILNNSTGTLTISNSVISGNSAIGGNPIVTSPPATGGTGTGGGIYNASTGTINITNSAISGNVAKGGSPSAGNNGFGGSGEGGGILNKSGTVNLTNSTLAGNSATNGDIRDVGGTGTGTTLFGFGAFGGGIRNGGIVNVTNSTISGNSANGSMNDLDPDTIVLFGSFGGGIYNEGTLKVTNSTLFGNLSNGGSLRMDRFQPGPGAGGGTAPSLGGGIANAGQVTLTNSTISGNTVIGVTSLSSGFASSTGNGGGVANTVGLVVNAKNTIIAGNTGDLGPDFYGTLTSQGWNLIGNNKDATIVPAPGTADQIGTNAAPINPLLGPLADNGGPTQTMALLAGSPAIDKGAAAIDPITATPITTDQRGFMRPVDDPAIANATGGNGSDIGAFEVQAVPPTVTKAFNPATITVGGASLLTITLSSAGITLTGANLTDNLPTGLTTVSNTAATTCGGTASQTATSVSLSGGTIPAGGSCSLSVQVTSTTVNTYTNTILAGALTTNNGGANTTAASTTLTVNPAPVVSAIGPGTLLPAAAELSDQKAGSVLFYNLYSSSIAAPSAQNTRIAITNTNPSLPIAVHLFFVDGATCSIADSMVCLTPNQTASFLASDIDPGTTGYIVAVASDLVTGCPAEFNYLIGDEYVKLSSGHAANLAAEAFAALAGGLPACNGLSVTALLSFDGASYNRAPRVLAASNIPSRADGNDTLIVLNRLGGSLAAGAATLSNLFGILYDDAENPLSFTFTAGVCQFRSSLSSNFPRTAPRFEQFIPAGRSGWAKFYSLSDVALLGAQLNFNANAGTAANAFNQGHNLHKLTLTSAAQLTVPIFPPNC